MLSDIYTFSALWKKKSFKVFIVSFALLQPKEKSFEKHQNCTGLHSTERQGRKKTELWSWILRSSRRGWCVLDSPRDYPNARVLALKASIFGPLFKGSPLPCCFRNWILYNSICSPVSHGHLGNLENVNAHFLQGFLFHSSGLGLHWHYNLKTKVCNQITADMHTEQVHLWQT
jgi:hypothetical protein